MKKLYKFLYNLVGFLWTSGIVASLVLVPSIVIVVVFSALGIFDFEEATRGANWWAVGGFLTAEIILSTIMIMLPPPR